MSGHSFSFHQSSTLNTFQVKKRYIFKCVLRASLLTTEAAICLYTLSLPCPCLAMASYLIFPSASTCTARALDVFFFLPISRGNWATWISGKAPPSPKSYKHTDFTAQMRRWTWCWLVLHSSTAVTPNKKYPQTPPNKRQNQSQQFYHVSDNYVCNDLPQVSGAPSLFCVRKEGALCGTKPGRWSRTSGPGASPLPPAGPGTAGSALVKSWTQNSICLSLIVVYSSSTAVSPS